MVADGRASNSEKMTIQKIMMKINSGWTMDECDNHINLFIENLRTIGYPEVLKKSLSQIETIKQPGYQEILIKCVNTVAQADGKLSDAELKLCKRILKEVESPKTTIE